MMIDYDSTFDKIQELYKNSSGEVHKAYSKCLDVISEMPTIDAEPVKHGKWDCVNDDENIYMCTSCGYELCFDRGLRPKDYDFRFCPYCCAKMDEN